MELHSALAVEVLVGLTAVQRLAEMAWSRRNQRRAAPGSTSADRPAAWAAMVLLHGLWLAGVAVEVHRAGAPAPPALYWAGLGLFAAGQGLRLWAIATLGRAWNARAVVDPATPIVTRGPYRFARHPNYTGVLCELIGLPLAAGAWWTLALTLPAHALVLAHRIRNEERLLRALPGYEEAMASKGRLLPRLRPSGSR